MKCFPKEGFCWTYCQMLTVPLSSFFRAIGMIISLEWSLNMIKKGQQASG